jgi:MlaC protein
MLKATIRTHVFTLALISTSTFACPSFAAQPGWTSVQKIVSIFSSPGAGTYTAAGNYIDYDAMSQRSLGGEWSKLTAKQKHDYSSALRTLMEQRYYPRWHRIFSKSKVEYVSQSNAGAGGDLLVKTNVVVGKKHDAMTWRLNGHNDKVISLAIGEKDLLDRLTNRLQPRLKKGGFPSMLSWMQAHAKGEASPTQTSSAESVLGESQ